MSMPTEPTELRDMVRERYAAAARLTSPEHRGGPSCCDARVGIIPEDQRGLFGAELYDGGDGGDSVEVPEPARLASLGCGNPLAIADLQAGETVLDLGSGGRS